MSSFGKPLFSVLELTSWSMLGWLAAGMLPWLIHRWHRRHHLRTPWAAVDLLLAAVQQRARRIRFQQWLLLVVRTAILLMVAFAATEPVWRQWTLGAGSGAQVHRVLVIDQSYSMRCVHDDMTRFERARAQARRLIQEADAATIISWGQESENVIGRPVFDTSLALAALEKLEPTFACVDLKAALDSVSAALDRAEQDIPQLLQHQVFFLTDLGRNTWALDESTHSKVDALAERARLNIVDLDDEQCENVAVTGLLVEPTTVLRGREVSISTRLRNYGKSDRTELKVQLTVDGRPVKSWSVNLPGGGTEVVSFAHQFTNEGRYTIESTIEIEDDCLPVDNRRWLVVDVLPQLRVACFAGQSGAADNVVRALSFAQRTIVPEVLPMSRLVTLDLTEYDAVFLAGVNQLSEREVNRLDQYVQTGGALTVLLDEQVKPLRILPVEILASTSEGDFRFDPLEYLHPVVRPFRGREQAGLLSVVVSKYMRMQAKEQLETILAFDSGDPAIVVSRHGLGRIAIVAMPLALSMEQSAPWSSFAVSPSFVPVMRELVNYLVSDQQLQRFNLLPGQTALSAWPPSSLRQNVEVHLPAGESTELSAPGEEDKQLIVFAETDEAGIYSMRTENEEFARFAVNLDTNSELTDSNLSALDRDMLPSGILALSVSPELRLAGADFRLARILLAGVVLLLFFELTMAWLMGRGWA